MSNHYQEALTSFSLFWGIARRELHTFLQGCIVVKCPGPLIQMLGCDHVTKCPLSLPYEAKLGTFSMCIHVPISIIASV